MYYFIPKAANRPVYSVPSIIHFWSSDFIYIWAGPHHLLYSALPNWAQNLGVSLIMLIAHLGRNDQRTFNAKRSLGQGKSRTCFKVL
jgi:cbb3-type cytochrome oxidase subunit 1